MPYEEGQTDTTTTFDSPVHFPTASTRSKFHIRDYIFKVHSDGRLDHLASGADGVVAKALYQPTKKPVVVKIVDLAVKGAAENVAHEVAVMKKWARFDEATVALLATFKEQNKAYLVMQPGGRSLEQGTFAYEVAAGIDPQEATLDSIADYAAQISYILETTGMVHGDLTAGNILVEEKLLADGDSEQTVRLIDLVTATEPGEAVTRATTPEYAAPELHLDAAAGKRSVASTAMDAWSLGIVLYREFTHESLFGTTDQKATLAARQAVILARQKTMLSDPKKFSEQLKTKLLAARERFLAKVLKEAGDEPEAASIVQAAKDNSEAMIESFHDLLVKLLKSNPADRPSWEAIQAHPFITERFGAEEALSPQN